MSNARLDSAVKLSSLKSNEKVLGHKFYGDDVCFVTSMGKKHYVTPQQIKDATGDVSNEATADKGKKK